MKKDNLLNISIYHPNGRKYFYFLEKNKHLKVSFRPYVFIRKKLGYHKGDNGKVKGNMLFKLPSRSNISIFCMSPFDPNVLIIIFQKLFFNSKIIYHTSSADHVNGNFFKLLAPIFRFIINKFVDVVVCTPKVIENELKKTYQTKIVGIDHPFENIDLSFIDKKETDYIFVGEKSKKKGFDRFMTLAKLFPNKKFISVGTELEFSDLKTTNNHESYGFKNKKDVYKLIQKSKFLLVPSRSVNGWEELFGIVIIEALSLGTGVIASDHQGPKYIQTKVKNSIKLVKDSDDVWNKIDLNHFKYSVKKVNLDFLTESFIQSQWLELFDTLDA